MECNCALIKSGLACCLNCTKRGWRCISHFPLALAYNLHSPQLMGSKGLYMKKCLKPCWPELPRTNHACLQKPNPFRDTVPLKVPSSYRMYIRSTWEWTSCLRLGHIQLKKYFFYLHYFGCHSKVCLSLIAKIYSEKREAPYTYYQAF